MTDNEIIKLLECCKKSQCSKCYYSKECDGYTQVNYALDLITRQQAEIENLKVENQSLRGAANSLKMHYEKAQAEVERLKDANNTFEKAFHIQEQNIKDWLPITVFNYEIKTEAYKEFARKLKEKDFSFCIDAVYDGSGAVKVIEINQSRFNKQIDNLLKEMVGEEK